MATAPNKVVEQELDGWIAGQFVVARATDPYGTVSAVIADSENSYTLLRGFPIGSGAAVSVDLERVSADTIIAHLVKGLGA